jgi:hypothetical protein
VIGQANLKLLHSTDTDAKTILHDMCRNAFPVLPKYFRVVVDATNYLFPNGSMIYWGVVDQILG